MTDEVVWRGRFEGGSTERTPEHGNSGHASGVARAHVVGRIADEHGFGGLIAEPIERDLHGLGVRLVTLAGIEANDVVDVAVQIEPLERAMSELVRFARDECGWVMARTQESQGIAYPVERS